MRTRRIAIVLLGLMVVQCGTRNNGQPASCATTAVVVNGTALPPLTGTNVLPLTVNGPGCNNYPNQPCVSVTLCTPGTATCQTVDNVLLDTGSYGLRIFKSLVNPGLVTATPSGAGVLAECVQFGDGTSEWGEVAVADVRLGGMTASQVPVQLIDSTFGNPPDRCTSAASHPDTSPAQAGINGVLGIGPFRYDCGLACAAAQDNDQYFLCAGAACSSIKTAVAQQVQNPALALPTDNNGLVVELPSVDAQGAASLSGYLVLGLGTRDNNQPSVSTVLSLDGYGMFPVHYPSQSSEAMFGFLDTGTNYYLFPQVSGSLPVGSGQVAGEDLSQMYCPSQPTVLQVANGDRSCVSFSIGNAQALLGSSRPILPDIGGAAGLDLGFDFGLPFFFGRNVVVGFESRQSPYGDGPLVAY